MSRFLELLDKYQGQEDTAAEAEELAGLLQGHDGRARTFYDALMLEVDLYESYAGIARLQAVPRRRWRPQQLLMAWAVAVSVLIGLVTMLMIGRPPAPAITPAPPAAAPKVEVPPPVPPPPPTLTTEHDDDHKPGGRQAEAEREFQKGMREVERKRAQGKFKEADEKLREIEKERDKKLKGLDR